jgi:predicted metal-dependent phosphoesterase TrpH
LHVHTLHSGMCTVPLMDRICRESYNQPEAVYSILKRRGMDLVTVTDHDSVDSVESLRRNPDFFLSEEVTCHTPSGTELHMGVYDISERHHGELQSRRDDLMSLIAYLGEQNLFFSINHVFSSLTGPRTDADFSLFEAHFPGVETLNGQMLEACNRSAESLARQWDKAAVAGSDAHTLAALGLTYTEVPGARNAREFMDGLKQGYSRGHGGSGNYCALTQAVWNIGANLISERPWAIALAPLFLAVPLVTLGNFLREYAFHRKWSRRLVNGATLPLTPGCVTETAL